MADTKEQVDAATVPTKTTITDPTLQTIPSIADSNGTIVVASTRHAGDVIPSSQPSKSRTTTTCGTCQVRTSLYQCPRCQRRTCSLDCCRRHKVEWNCNGKRDVTAFLNVGSMTDATLHSDLHFLEDIVGQLDRTARTVQETMLLGSSRSGTGSNQHQSQQRNRAGTDGTNRNSATTDSSVSSQHPLLQATVSTSSFVRNRISPFISTSAASQHDNHHHHHPLPDPCHHKRHQQRRPHRKLRLSLEQHVATTAGTTVLRLPAAMERHQLNTSRLVTMSHHKANAPLDSTFESESEPLVVFWTVEWFFYHSFNGTQPVSPLPLPIPKADKMCGRRISKGLRHNISERHTVADLVRDVAKDVANVNATMSVLIKQIPCRADRPLYVCIASIDSSRICTDDDSSPSTTLRDALSDRTVIEYPTVYIVPPDRMSEFPLTIAEVATTDYPL